MRGTNALRFTLTCAAMFLASGNVLAQARLGGVEASVAFGASYHF
jgi:hypothetical protein